MLPSRCLLDRELPNGWRVVGRLRAGRPLNLLRSEGLVYGVAGKGTFVAPNPRMIRTAPHRYFQRAERTYVHEAERAGGDQPSSW